MDRSFRVEDWYSAQFDHEDQATCMTCGETIYFCKSVEEDRWRKPKGIRGYWSLTKRPTFNTYWVEDKTDAEHDHQPKQFCRVVPSREGNGHCGKHVKYEDQVAEIYACGHHRATETAEIKKREIEAKRKAEEARRLAITKYEIGEYTAMAQWLRDNGYEAWVDGYRANSGYQHDRPRLNRKIELDLHMVYDFLRGGEDAKVHSKQDDSGSVDGSEVQVHAAQPLDPFDD